ncbi:hypothetical protein T439DRAFT_16267 [Meredithblackwellia eburnea MCA 4105]
MILFNSLVSTALLVSSLVLASSNRPPPLSHRSLSHPTNPRLTIIPRRDTSYNQFKKRNFNQLEPSWDDNFVISFKSHGSPHSTHLSLRPASTLVHPDGIRTIHTHTDSDGQSRVTHTSYIPRESIRAYEGWVIDLDEHDPALRDEQLQYWIREETAGVVRPHDAGRGMARIVLLDSEDDDQEGNFYNDEDDEGRETNIRFQGSFTSAGELFTIHSTESYLRSRDPLDPEPPLIPSSPNGKRSVPTHPRMVIVRESDTLSPVQHLATLRSRGLAVPAWLDDSAARAVAVRAEQRDLDNEDDLFQPVHSCGHDRLSFNVDPFHPVYEAALEQAVYDAAAATSSSPWLKTVFGLPSRGPPPPSFEEYHHHSGDSSSSSLYSYPPPLPKSRLLSKRQSGGDISGGSNVSSNFINTIGSTVGCPKSAQVLFMGVAMDCTYVNHYGSADQARTQVLTDFNSASALYLSSFNVSLGIVELNVQSGACPTTSAQVDQSNPWNVGCAEGGGPGLDLNARLSTFSAWRGAKGGADGAGLWHLMTNCSSGSEVGVAWLGQLCKVSASTSDGQSTSGTGVTAVTRSEWQVIAHEIGHSFGAIHDCATGCTLTNSNPICCPLSTTTCDASANYIMSPVSQKNVSSFSPCSIGNICSTLSSSLNTTCLATPGQAGNPPLISLKSCGNGILEAGEDCDPGNAADPCCDAATCKFAAGAVCDPLNSLCCTTSCQIATAGTVCRASIDAQCDIAETCSGNSSSCPADAFQPDGKSCGSNGLACATGVCTSRTLQCQTAGASLGLSAACPSRASDSCSISCQDPSSSSDCIVLQESFRSGTPCGYAGTCQNSVCVAGSPLEVAKSWYR